MLKTFLARLRGETPEEAPMDESDTRTAVAALLVHAARVDDDYTDVERGLIEDILAYKYSMRAEDAKTLRQEGEEADDTSVDAFRFTHVIKTSLSEEERFAVLQALWSVVLSDEDRGEHEDALVRKLVDLMGMSSIDSAHARQKVEAAMRA